MRKRRFLTLLGLKHVGKSSVAEALLMLLPDATAVDIDVEMVSISRREGWFPTMDGPDPPVRRLYRHLGPRPFASWEEAVIKRILTTERQQEHAGPCIIATGGGVCDNDAALQILEEARPVVYLYEDPVVLYRRIRKGGIPAFLNADDPRRAFIEMAERRDGLYREFADHLVDVSGLKIGEAAEQVLKQVRKGNYGW